ncbi:MAG: cobalamin-binding protein [Rhodothermaceae bacterium]|nr:cobalamin-binding protein [Rhodothermaceae bacterium]MXW33549.1 cobalamin-binding protein [Rhodothermaceae bacterium]MXX96548.1 cobalamin-binding protein [Rhodothermaceae bacterium]MXZ18647.1 cobalamin-binding protein [Rhodothermaceae bacterium]MXZ58756.1 cobalamin-binding protein [Rhodothermaceae bacterium]
MDHRIVSLIASATEIVCALGFESNLVGRSHECDYPRTVETIPVCSSSKIITESSSAEIDDQVRTIVRDGLSVYKVDSELLDTISPSVIITQTQCEVCAVSLSDVKKAVCELVSSAPEIVSLEPMSLSDVWEDIQRVADALGDPGKGEELVSSLQSRLQSLRIKVQKISYRPRIACIEWTEPLMIAANWVPELVDFAGGSSLLSEPGNHSEYFSLDKLAASEPEVIAIMPCGFDIDRSLREMTSLTSSPQWENLPAVRNGRVYVTDGNQYFNRPGPRVVESAEILSECLHPGCFNFGHQGVGWIPWSPD